ncbi:hypothetical protein NV379_05455 [Paenibacillus sp. N1-5-1-14]|uniref:hypothetical protein n=1 Tax=Paenibacillus radicibacter TaxID=2972488 RepID=UPI0021599D9A|nr:hypothetical protein [Paenibacillus radicibacter]MCR8642099.1 hypothetical protein [Paenibacillus radicibacter]
MNALSKVFALLIALLLLFVYPLADTFEKQDDISSLVAITAVREFVDAVRDKGYITPTMYNDFSKAVHATGNTFNIQMQHDHKRYNPVYTDPLLPGTFQNDTNVDYDQFFTDQIMVKLFPNENYPLDDKRRMYKLSTGDYFKVNLLNTNRTQASVMWDFINNDNTARAKIMIPYGGMVRNEDY